jgi:acyl carrier protein
MVDNAEGLIRATILQEIHRIAALHNKKLAVLTDRLPLLESGLDSLCVAILVASLDDALDLDPFAEDENLAFPVTLGDFIQLYENAAG